MSLLKRIGGTPTSTPAAETPAAAKPNPAASPRSEVTAAAPRSGASSNQERLLEVRGRVQRRLTDEVHDVNSTNPTRIRQVVEDILGTLLDGEHIILSRNERLQL